MKLPQTSNAKFSVKRLTSGAYEITRNNTEFLFKYLAVASPKDGVYSQQPIILNAARCTSQPKYFCHKALQYLGEHYAPQASDWVVVYAALVPSNMEIETCWDFGWEFTFRADGQFVGRIRFDPCGGWRCSWTRMGSDSQCETLQAAVDLLSQRQRKLAVA